MAAGRAEQQRHEEERPGNGWLLSPVRWQEPADPMCVHWGWRGDAALPSTPCGPARPAGAPGRGSAGRRPPASRRRGRTRHRHGRARSQDRDQRSGASFVVNGGPAFRLARKSNPARSVAAVTRRAEAHAEDPRQRVDGGGRPCASDAGDAQNRRGVAPCLRPGVEGAEPLASPLCTQGVCWLITSIGVMSQRFVVLRSCRSPSPRRRPNPPRRCPGSALCSPSRSMPFPA